MKRIALAAFALVALAASAVAQVIPPGTNPVPTGGAYNSSPITCTSGQACWAQLDVNGYLKTVSSGTPSGTQAVNITQILGAAPSLTNPLWVFPATGATFPVSLSGNTTVVGPTADGSPATTAPVLIGGTSDGTATGTVDVWKVDTAGIGYVNNAPSAAAAAGLTPTTTAAIASNSVTKASAGNLYSFEVAADSTLSGAAWWVMIFDATSLPANGAVTPRKCYAYPSGTTSASYGWNTPIAFTTGITIGVSTTGCFTLTASVHAFISGDAQ